MTINEHHLDALRKGVLDEFTRDMSTCLIATTPMRLAEHARNWRWKLTPLNGVPADDALVVQKPGFVAQLWVRHGVRSYRRLYLAYLQQHVDSSISGIGTDWQVDHLQASHRFAPGHPVYFIRMALVARGVNASYGAGFEKAFYGRERGKEPEGGFHMDWLALLKSQGVRLPGKAVGNKRWRSWSWDVATRLEESVGEDRVLAYHGITTMLNLGYREHFAPLPVLPEHESIARSYPSWACCPGLEPNE